MPTAPARMSRMATMRALITRKSTPLQAFPSRGGRHEHGLDDLPDRVDLEGFLQITVSRLLQKRACVGADDITRAEDDPPGEIVVELPHFLIELLPAHPGHLEVGDDQIVRLFLDLAQRY